MSGVFERLGLTAGELHAAVFQRDAMLAEQRHMVLDPDADSVCPRLDDELLCHHGRPMLKAQFECPDCIGAQGPGHSHFIDVALISPLVTFCRGCGVSLGTHGGELAD